MRGRAYAERGDPDKAITDCTEAIRLNPKLAVAYFLRGRAYEGKGDSGQAKRDFDKAKSLGLEVPSQ